MSIGFIIKKERLKQNIKQVHLVRGICSTSYLSKTESNSIIPSEEILNLLLERLNISIEHISEEKELEIFWRLSAAYKEAVLVRDKEKVKQFVKEFSFYENQFRTSTIYFLSLLKLFRLRLIAQLDVEELKNTIELFISTEKKMTNQERFLLNFNLGLYYYDQSKFVMSLAYMEKCIVLLDETSVDEWKRADFHSALSIIYGINHLYIKAIHYTNLALNYFQENHLHSRAIDCYIVLGNSYKRLQDVDNAINSYTKAQEIARKLKFKHYEAMFSQNLASLMVSIGDNEKAIDNFIISLSSREEGTDGYFLTIISLVKIYSKQGNSIKVLDYCNKALALMERIPQKKKQLETYYVHLTLFKGIHNKDLNIEGTIKNTVRYFEGIGDLQNTLKYSFLMANYYYQNKKYKKSSIYQEKIRQIIFTQKSIKHWEEL